MSQNFHFIKVNTVKINPKEVAIFFINKKLCATPNKSPEPPLLRITGSFSKKCQKNKFLNVTQ